MKVWFDVVPGRLFPVCGISIWCYSLVQRFAIQCCSCIVAVGAAMSDDQTRIVRKKETILRMTEMASGSWASERLPEMDVHEPPVISQ